MMYFNPYVGRSPNLSFFGLGPWAIIHGIGPKLAFCVICPNFTIVDTSIGWQYSYNVHCSTLYSLLSRASITPCVVCRYRHGMRSRLKATIVELLSEYYRVEEAFQSEYPIACYHGYTYPHRWLREGCTEIKS